MANLTETLGLTAIWLNIIPGILLFTFGIIGNSLAIYVFTRPIFRNTNSGVYLLACSISCCIQLINTLLPRILSDGFHVYIFPSNDNYCRICSAISAVSSLCAISYPCWSSFDQYISTSRNATRRSCWSSKRFVYRAVFSTILFWFSIYLPNSIFYRASDNICISSNLIISFIYSYAIGPLTYSILPIIFLTYFNTGIVNNLRDIPVTAITNTNKRMIRQVQRIVVPQLIILILSGTPFTLQLWYSSATRFTMKDAHRLAIEGLIGHIVFILFHLNYVCSFYIYVIMSSEVRKTVQNLFQKQNILYLHATNVVAPKT